MGQITQAALDDKPDNIFNDTHASSRKRNRAYAIKTNDTYLINLYEQMASQNSKTSPTLNRYRYFIHSATITNTNQSAETPPYSEVSTETKNTLVESPDRPKPE